MRQLVYAACFFEVGLLLVVLPWTGYWNHNYVFDVVPLLREFTRNPYLRGAVSGLGMLNLSFGMAEVVAFVESRFDHRSQG